MTTLLDHTPYDTTADRTDLETFRLNYITTNAFVHERHINFKTANGCADIGVKMAKGIIRKYNLNLSIHKSYSQNDNSFCVRLK